MRVAEWPRSMRARPIARKGYTSPALPRVVRRMLSFDKRSSKGNGEV
jgi:hypothetical protein